MASHYSADEMGADFGRMDGHHGVMTAQVTQFNQLLDEAKAIAAAAAQTWTGAAQDAYAQQQKTWDNSALELNQCLSAITKALAETRSDMASTDLKNAGLFN